MGNRFIDLAEDRSSVRVVLQNMGLLCADALLDVTPLTGGVSSNILKITANEKQFCLKQALPQLKVAKEWLAPVERIFAEIDWMVTVAGIIPDAVPHILGVDKERLCFAMDYLPAEHYTNWKSQLLAGDVDVDFAGQMGAVLNHIHRETARNVELAQRFAWDDNFFSLRLEPYLSEIARQHPQHADYIHFISARTLKTKLALVHGDISPKNILRGPAGPVILDAECAWYGDPAFDLAFCLNHFLLKAVIAPDAETRRRLLASFQIMADRYLDGIHWEPAQDFEARAATLLPCLLLARVDGKSPAEYLSDRHADTVRRASQILLERKLTKLNDIQVFWKKESER